LRTLAEAAQLPLTYYHVPGLTKILLDAAQLAHLCEEVPLAGIKFADVDTFKATEILHRCPNVSILTGMEEVLLAGLVLNCYHGTVGASQNFMPGPYVEILRAFSRGDIAEASRISTSVSRIVAVQSLFDFTAAVYGFMNLLGYDYGRPLSPMTSLGPAEMARLEVELLRVIRPDPINDRRLIECRDFL
jgi:N-acetylneuraminate lyase